MGLYGARIALKRRRSQDEAAPTNSERPSPPHTAPALLGPQEFKCMQMCRGMTGLLAGLLAWLWLVGRLVLTSRFASAFSRQRIPFRRLFRRYIYHKAKQGNAREADL